ncbi:MAG: hypothetical protein P8L85_11340 [Rubripirellula sp.]|nr:hypothetical protein [Rubripirellula sp.]
MEERGLAAAQSSESLDVRKIVADRLSQCDCDALHDSRYYGFESISHIELAFLARSVTGFRIAM